MRCEHLLPADVSPITGPQDYDLIFDKVEGNSIVANAKSIGPR